MKALFVDQCNAGSFFINIFSIFIRLAWLDLCIYTLNVKMQHSAQFD